MNLPPDENSIDELLTDAFGPRPEADFDRWRRQHSKAVEMLGSQDAVTSQKRSVRMRRVTRIAVAAVVVLGVGIAVSYVARGQNGSVTFAEVCQEIRKARTLTYTAVFIQSATDGETTWIETERQQVFFKRPGRLRTLEYDHRGELRAVFVEDDVAGRELQLAVKEKRARLIEKGEPTQQQKQRVRESPDQLTGLASRITAKTQSLGSKKIGGREATGFRLGSDKGPGNDVWVDVKTKEVVLVQIPCADKYDPEKDPARGNPPGKRAKTKQAVGGFLQDVTYDQELDDSLFSLDTPAGYTFELVRWKEPNENDVNDWLRTLAGYYGGTFPTWDVTSSFPAEDCRKIAKKDEKERTPIEKKIWETVRPYSDYGRRNPIARFVETTAGNTWHYQGQGVKLGDQDAVVWWYKPKGSKNYRVTFGDLITRIVAPEDLPLSENE